MNFFHRLVLTSRSVFSRSFVSTSGIITEIRERQKLLRRRRLRLLFILHVDRDARLVRLAESGAEDASQRVLDALVDFLEVARLDFHDESSGDVGRGREKEKFAAVLGGLARLERGHPHTVPDLDLDRGLQVGRVRKGRLGRHLRGVVDDSETGDLVHDAVDGVLYERPDRGPHHVADAQDEHREDHEDGQHAEVRGLDILEERDPGQGQIQPRDDVGRDHDGQDDDESACDVALPRGHLSEYPTERV